MKEKIMRYLNSPALSVEINVASFYVLAVGIIILRWIA